MRPLSHLRRCDSGWPRSPPAERCRPPSRVPGTFLSEGDHCLPREYHTFEGVISRTADSRYREQWLDATTSLPACRHRRARRGVRTSPRRRRAGSCSSTRRSPGPRDPGHVRRRAAGGRDPWGGRSPCDRRRGRSAGTGPGRGCSRTGIRRCYGLVSPIGLAPPVPATWRLGTARGRQILAGISRLRTSSRHSTRSTATALDAAAGAAVAASVPNQLHRVLTTGRFPLDPRWAEP
jgi:hypothetical protein